MKERMKKFLSGGSTTTSDVVESVSVSVSVSVKASLETPVANGSVSKCAGGLNKTEAVGSARENAILEVPV